MYADIIQKWNNLVQPEDLTYILGDVSFGKVSKTVELLQQLNGKKILIVGNHDHGNLRKEAFVNEFESIHDYLELNRNGYKVVMFHYPIYSWNGMYSDKNIHLYGHTHMQIPFLFHGKAMDVGMDGNEMQPYELVPLLDKISGIYDNIEENN